ETGFSHEESIFGRDAHVDAVVAHLHVDRPQAIFGVAAMAAGFDVEFPAMPRGDDVLALGEAQAAAGLVRRQPLLDAGNHLALTDRPAVVRAVILVGDQPVALPEDAELERIDAQHAVTVLGEFAELAHHDLGHRFTPLHFRCSCPAQSCWPRRYHICRSKKLRSAARMKAQIPVTASVPFTGRSPNAPTSS